MKNIPNCRKNINAGQEGQVTLEMLVVAPALLMFILMLFAAGYDVYIRLNAQAVNYSIGSSIARYRQSPMIGSSGLTVWGDTSTGDVVSAGIAGAGEYVYTTQQLHDIKNVSFAPLEGTLVRMRMAEFHTYYAAWTSPGGIADDTFIESVSGWMPGPFVSAKP